MKNGDKLLYLNPLPLPTLSVNSGQREQTKTTTKASGFSLPPLFPHNPLSWAYFIYSYIFTSPKITKIDVTYTQAIFKAAPDLYLWQNGFFGKGSLSRSEPTWIKRSETPSVGNSVAPLNTVPKAPALSREQITNIRRDERKKFKSLRSSLQTLQNKQKLNEISDEELLVLEDLKVQVDLLRNQEIVFEKQEKEEKKKLLEEPVDFHDLEYLQLQPVEVFFLKFALNVINVDFSLDELFSICCNSDIHSRNRFILEYVVYHHYRSLGWCARSGVKFGCDFLLYKRGPPFSHAEHSISIHDDQNTIDWFQLTTLTRVIGTVKKNLVLAFVTSPSESEFNEVLSKSYSDEKEKYQELFKLYEVSEIIYRRWAPSRSRD